MFRHNILRRTIRAISKSSYRPTPTIFSSRLSCNPSRALSSTPRFFDKEDKYTDASTASDPGSSGEHEGQFARTDKEVRVEYPEEHEFPRSRIVQGRGGMHFKRTLPTFSLEDRVAMITGGARGLGLVMSQALVASGADVAIIDLNGTAFIRPCNERMRC